MSHKCLCSFKLKAHNIFEICHEFFFSILARELNLDLSNAQLFAYDSYNGKAVLSSGT